MPYKELKLSDAIVGSTPEDVLHCPNCDGYYTHQGKVEIFNRGEDAKEGTHATIQGDDVHIDRNLTGNPSGRRQGLKISFDCEMCQTSFDLEIYQHKGNTFVRTRYEES
jgi:hypothetical protein